MLLDGRTAIVYGGASAIGGACARAFAREGAHVHLVGRTASTLEAVAAEIADAGGSADTAGLDAYDADAVAADADAVAAERSLDISLNVVQHGDGRAPPSSTCRSPTSSSRW